MTEIDDDIQASFEKQEQERARTGGLAFPFSLPHDFRYSEGGMTLRDYIAANCIQNACLHISDFLDGEIDADKFPGQEMRTAAQEAEQLAKAAYILADAMLKAREA